MFVCQQLSSVSLFNVKTYIDCVYSNLSICVRQQMKNWNDSLHKNQIEESSKKNGRKAYQPLSLFV